jgi:pyrroline-5-carboxylate reductase
MTAFALGDKVVVSDRTGWPNPPGYRFAGAKGTVVRWVSYDVTLKDFSDFVYVRIEEASEAAVAYVGNPFFFRAEDLTKVTQGSQAMPTAGTTIGVIGTGNMGSALVKGWLRAQAAGGGQPTPGRALGPHLIGWDKVQASVQRLLTDSPISAADSVEDLVARADVVLVVVKPEDAEEVLSTLARLARREQIVVSAMAGLTLEWMRGVLGPGPCLFRMMPNLAVEVGAGAVAVAAEPDAPAAAVETVLALFRPLGLVEVLPEELFDVVTAVSGSSPAFLAVAIESLEDGAVAAGLSRAAARTVVRQAALMTAQRLSEHSDSPAALREHLASAGETDPAAMELLEERGVRLAFQRAVEAAIERGRQMRKGQR